MPSAGTRLSPYMLHRLFKWNSVYIIFVFGLQENARALTLKVLLSIKPTQMDAAIEALNDVDLVDVLMKYIYRGFESPSDGSSAHLLQWHEKVYARYGVGCITRVLTCTNRA